MQRLRERHELLNSDLPGGGFTGGVGFEITWNDGVNVRPCRGNGADVEDVIMAAIGRLAFYQSTLVARPENLRAIGYLNMALEALGEKPVKVRGLRAVCRD